jgi:hypothetical protein
MDRKLARKNMRTAVMLGVFSLFMLGLTFVIAAIYIS